MNSSIQTYYITYSLSQQIQLMLNTSGTLQHLELEEKEGTSCSSKAVVVTTLTKERLVLDVTPVSKKFSMLFGLADHGLNSPKFG